jgi:SAM-dependent methyltransferase
MSGPDPDSVRASYDRLAAEYARRIYGELRHKPLDRELLDRFAERVRGRGAVCDLGCGPGQVARYLHERGVPAVGVDLSPGMVEQARRLNPGVEFRQGDLRALDGEDGAWAGIAAFYSIIHVPRAEVTAALRGLRRTLRPGGVLLLAFHVGDEVVHLDELWGEPVSVDFVFFRPAEMAGYLEEAGFLVEEVIERDPYPDVEHPSRRAYVFASRPPDG